MTASTRYSGPPRIATKRLRASNAIEREVAGLDARSAVALAFCTFWLSRHGSYRPEPAVVIRRALQCLAELLSSAQGEAISHERGSFMRAAAGDGSAITLTEARARIEAHIENPTRQPMDHWDDARLSQERLQGITATAARLDAHMAQHEADGLFNRRPRDSKGRILSSTPKALDKH